MKKKQRTIGIVAIIIAALLGGGYVLLDRDAGGFPATWSAAKTKVRPQLVTREFAATQRIVSAEISEVVDLAYVVHMGDTFQFINAEELKLWDVPPQTVHEQAIANMEKIAARDNPEFVEAEGSPKDKYVLVEPGDGYAAVRMLLPQFRARIAAALGDPFIAGVPTRDFLVFWSEGFSLGDQFARQVRTEFKDAGEYGLTRELFRFLGDTVEMTPNEG